jgi:hypothetical protein
MMETDPVKQGELVSHLAFKYAKSFMARKKILDEDDLRTELEDMIYEFLGEPRQPPNDEFVNQFLEQFALGTKK